VTGSAPRVLFSEDEIAEHIHLLAGDLARLEDRPEIVSPVLVGAFVFAADLMRALSSEGIDLPLEYLWLRSYGAGREGGEMKVLASPGETVSGKHVLLIDGVLDHGHTLVMARDLLLKAGARKVTTAVVVDKTRDSAPIKADHACFTGVHEFIVGYGMDDAGLARGLPYIGIAQ
jgi:hypoxanthine phosphoribosyltransferase